MAEPKPEPPSPHLAPCIVAAWVWLAVVLYAQVVIPTLFSVDIYKSKPEQLRALMPALERGFIIFQMNHGTFWCACAGILGCAIAAIRRSTKLANVMILLGIAVMMAMVWATLSHVPK